VKVQVNGKGFTGGVGVTDKSGCVAFEVAPPGGGGDYTVKLLGAGSVTYVDPVGQTQVEKTQTGVKPGNRVLVPFADYDQAARLTVRVANLDSSVRHVFLEPMFAGGGNTLQEPIRDGLSATFRDLYPGSYLARAGSSEAVAVTLAPGDDSVVDLVIP
jgi:hypothetical protein